MGGLFGGGGGGLSKLIAPSTVFPVPESIDPVQKKLKDKLRAEAGDKGASILIGDVGESVAQPATKRLLGE